MTLTGTDLGAVSDLAEALGLVDSGGTFQDSWLSDPGDHLATVLSNDAQRDALLRFVDEALGGGEQRTDPAGLVWLPIVECRDPKLTIYAVIGGDADSARPTGWAGLGHDGDHRRDGTGRAR